MLKPPEWDLKAAQAFAQYHLDKKAGIEKEPDPDRDDSLDPFR